MKSRYLENSFFKSSDNQINNIIREKYKICFVTWPVSFYSYEAFHTLRITSYNHGQNLSRLRVIDFENKFPPSPRQSMLICRKTFSEKVSPRFKPEFHIDNNIDLGGRGGLERSIRSPVIYVQDSIMDKIYPDYV